MQRKRFQLLKILCANVIVLAAAALNGSSAAAASICSNSPVSNDLWTDAQQNLASQLVANLTFLDDVPVQASIHIVSTSAPATSPSYDKFAAFYLPPSILTDVALADIFIKMEKDTSITEPISVLPTSPGTLLLISTMPKDCRFLLLVPAGSKSAFPVASAQHTVGANAIPKLIDELYRRMFPSGPTSENIVVQGISDPIYKWRFAQAMQKPFTVLVPPDFFSLPPTTPIAKATNAPNLPDRNLWQMAIGRFAWPDSLRSLDLQTSGYWPLLTQINQRSHDNRAQDAVKNDLSILHNMLSEIKPLGEIAKKDYDSLTKLDVSSLVPFEMAQYGGHLMTLGRVIGNDYDLLVSNATAQYEALYAKSVGSPALTPLEPFNRENLLKYRSKQHRDILSLAPLTTSNLDQLVPKKSNQIPKGDAYIVFKDTRNPITQSDLIQTEIVLALSTESLLNAVSSELSAKIPADSCAWRYNHGPLVGSTNNGSLFVSADVQVQVRTCVTHDWICFKGWTPHWCKNTIKTDLFNIDDRVSAILTTAADEQVIAASTITNIPYQTPELKTKSIAFQPIDSVSGTKIRLTLKKAFFTKRAGTDEILWILVANMEPIGLTEALLLRESLKATLALKDETK